ncbi:MAG: DUF2225 domain-containing protein [Lachnospiraceae bacterium]|nr:DUF2225 domain-containing protein [Lachnospiraceae bacterium]
MGLFSGMEKFGLKNVDEKKLYEKQEAPVEKKKEVVKPQASAEPEESFLFPKKYNCPVCSSEITSLTVKSSKVRMIGSDMDLRPRYQQMDATKYDVVLCPKCGYANIAKNFPMVMPAHRKLIIDNISKTFHYDNPNGPIYSYDEAITRYKIALSNAMVKSAKDSEKAYICLKMAWVIRGKSESLEPSMPDYEDAMEECKVDERGALQLARDGFVNARATEDFPLAGMDEPTVDYLISALSVELDDPKTAAKLLSNIIVSKTANSRVKDRARDLMATVKKMLEEA